MSTTWRASAVVVLLTVMPGVTWAQARVRPEKIVKSGDVVSTRAVVAGVEATGSAIAQQSGALGDVIRVINKDSRRSFKARVTAPGQVEVVNEK